MSSGNDSYYQGAAHPKLLTTTIPDHFQSIVDKFGPREALVSIPQSRRFTYEQLATEVDRLARGLLAAGYGMGSRLGIWSTNNYQWVVLQLACARIGALLVNINPAYRLPELAHALNQVEVEGLFIIPAFRTSNYLAMVAELLPELENRGVEVICFDPAPGAPSRSMKLPAGMRSWDDLITAGDKVSREQLAALTASLDCHDPINIQFTSGTTGHPKAVLLSHHNILNNAWFAAQALGFSAEDRLCVCVPYYHCFGTVLASLLALSCGGCQVIACDHFDPCQVLAAIEAEQCTVLHGVPTMFMAELNHADFSPRAMESLRTGIMAGAPCPPPLLERVMSEMHCPEILVGYGQTEASPLTHLTERFGPAASRLTSVGRNLAHQEVKVIDTKGGGIVALGEVGEVCFRGYHIMAGYYNDPQATAAAIDEEGWLHSGDLGSMDRDGYLTITGRLKDMIIRGGENIYPAEIEAVLFAHPGVAQAAVFGVPDDYWGEEVMAWIIPKEGHQLLAAQLRHYCQEQMSHFKVPRHICFKKEFPLTVTGKVQKYLMRQEALASLGDDGNFCDENSME
ncbi:MAG: AMP-binding protein [Thermodesulfobacteriota bacterium]